MTEEIINYLQCIACHTLNLDYDPFILDHDTLSLVGGPFSLDDNLFSLNHDLFCLDHDPLSLDLDPSSLVGDLFSLEVAVVSTQVKDRILGDEHCSGFDQIEPFMMSIL